MSHMQSEESRAHWCPHIAVLRPDHLTRLDPEPLCKRRQKKAVMRTLQCWFMSCKLLKIPGSRSKGSCKHGKLSVLGPQTRLQSYPAPSTQVSSSKGGQEPSPPVPRAVIGWLLSATRDLTFLTSLPFSDLRPLLPWWWWPNAPDLHPLLSHDSSAQSAWWYR